MESSGELCFCRGMLHPGLVAMTGLWDGASSANAVATETRLAEPTGSLLSHGSVADALIKQPRHREAAMVASHRRLQSHCTGSVHKHDGQVHRTS